MRLRTDKKNRLWPALRHNMGLALFFVAAAAILFTAVAPETTHTITDSTAADGNIKWVDFNVPYRLLEKAMELDIATHEEDVSLDWITLLALSAARSGGDFSSWRASELEELAAQLQSGAAPESLTENTNLLNYYQKAYSAVLAGFLGEYEVEIDGEWKQAYGLKAFSPIAAGFYYSDYDDFGNGRSYGFKRTHLGHDLMVSPGTPVVSVEGGTVEALGWNQYGGWRIGIRSFDKKRYYYYAHLRKDHPYAANMYIGQTVEAGDVIGYSGQTGYSIKENVNNIDTPHLHYGMQLIFDEAEKDSPNQIWIDLYAITRLLSEHRADVVQDYDTKEYERRYPFREWNSAAPGIPTSSPQQDEALSSDTASLPIIMYHSLLKDSARHGDFTISPDLFAQDLAYLKERGYETVFMSDVIRYVEEGVPLPEKPIVLTFDDGFYNNAYYGLPLLEEYDAKAVFSLVGSLTDQFSENGDNGNPNYSYLTWEEAKTLVEGGRIELQNHSYNMHGYDSYRQGALKRYTETEDEYRQFFIADVGQTQQRMAEKTGWTPNTFTYPYGLMENGTTSYLMELGFSASLSCNEGINYITKKPENSSILFGMKRILRPADQSSVDFFGKWDVH